MHIGLQLDHAGAGANAARMLAQARLAERCGLDSVWFFDHVLTPVTLTSHYPYEETYPMTAADPFLDPLGAIGVLAGATERIAFGTEVLVAPYRHPIVLGKALATIEQFAPGRIICGLGSGWMREEFDALGVPFERRGQRMDEYIAALRAVWSGEPNAFEGEAYSWAPSGFNPAPTRPIPLLLGGHAPPARRRAIRLADGWATILGALEDPSHAGQIAWLRGFRDELEAAGRDPAGFDVLACEQVVDRRRGADAVLTEIAALRDAGVTMLALLADDETVDWFAAEVRPQL
jgi:probable F420-dependent oxidoreductase